MTIIQMQYFQAACKHMNYTKAAEELHITQPAMSLAMRDLEKECGVALFIRDKNTLKITDEGKVLLEEISLVLIQYEHLTHVVNNLSLQRSYIRIGLSTFSGNLVYPFICRQYLQRYPGIQVMSMERSTKRQFEMLDDNHLDVIITTQRPDESGNLFSSTYDCWPMKKTNLVFSVHKNHPLATKKSVTMTEIAAEPLVLLSDNFNQTKRLKYLFEEANVSPQVIHYTSQMYSIERFIESGTAAGFLPSDTAEKNPEIKGLQYQDGEYQTVQLFWRKDRLQFDATRKFINLVKELYPKSK